MALAPGRNDVILAARDGAGNVTSKSVRIIRAGTPTTIGLTPTARTMLVNETTELTLADEFGAVVPAATWSSSDPSIVSVSTDDPPVLTALQSGTITITATNNGLSAEASLTVLSGITMPHGTTRWSSSGFPGFSVAQNIVANRVDLSVPDLFSIEMAGDIDDCSGRYRCRRISVDSGGSRNSSDGRFVWRLGRRDQWIIRCARSSIDILRPVCRSGRSARMALRLIGKMSRPAQAPDGTIYTIERYPIGRNNPNGTPILETQILVLDGVTGTLSARYLLAREGSRYDSNCVPNFTTEVSPITLGPVVGLDGHGYVLLQNRKAVIAGPGSHCTTVSQDVGVTLLRVAPTGAVTSTSIYSQHCNSGPPSICDQPPQLKEIFPDGIGGTLRPCIGHYQCKRAHLLWRDADYESCG